MRTRCAVLFLFAGAAVAPVSLAAVTLKTVQFPAVLTGTTGTTYPPPAAPVSQRVVFHFDGKPVIGPAVSDALRIVVAPTNTLGQPIGSKALGSYEVVGRCVIFTPRLPTKPLPVDFGPTTALDQDAGLPGLLPETVYRISARLNVPKGVLNMGAVSATVPRPLDFTTVPVVYGPLAGPQYFGNAQARPPVLVAGKTHPAPGASGIHPNAFADPAGLFAGIPAALRPPFRLVFQGPLDPAADNFGETRIRLRAVLDPNLAPISMPVGADVVLTVNEPDRAELLIYPAGILPLGHTVALELSDLLASLSETAAIAPGGTPTFSPVALYVIAPDPAPGTGIDDLLVEDFSSNLHQDTSLAAGRQLAAWDVLDSDHLRATYGFGGDGSLGRFQPPNQPLTIHLDTDFQTLPLPGGATPDITQPSVVIGGVFNFSEFRLPPSVTLVAQGTKPLIVNATGNVLIQGAVLINGASGTFDPLFDVGVFPLPGGSAGAGGGRGGDSHPVQRAPNGGPITFIQTPQYGGSGYGPGNVPGGGGGGGQCGCTMPWLPFTGSNCATAASASGDGSRGAGGGGGSFYPFHPAPPENPAGQVSGRRGAIGIADHLPVCYDPSAPIPPAPQAYQALPGNPTNAVARANPNLTFTQAYQQGLIYDSGSTMSYTNSWAQTKHVTLFGSPGPAVFADANPANDFIGPGGELAAIQGGQGGGAGGSRTEGLSLVCFAYVAAAGMPPTVLDARGGAGGGGGGALLIQARGFISIQGPRARIDARGGHGAGGEYKASSSQGGGGGGGSGGAVILKAAANVVMNDPLLPATVIDVSGGCGDDANNISSGNVSGADSGVLQCFDGGPGGPGIVQIHVPSGVRPAVDVSRITARVNPSVYNTLCTTSAFTNISPLVPMSLTPFQTTSESVARSTWYDLGAVTPGFRPHVSTPAGSLAGPIFGIPGGLPFFQGTNLITGQVLTTPAGSVVAAALPNISIDAPDLGLTDFIPNGPSWYQSVRVLFEGANEDPADPGNPDLATATGFVADTTLLNGKRFVRFEIVLDIAANPVLPGSLAAPRPQMNFLRLPFRY